jgi:N-acetylglucosaminyldiphosphoundecaprenol N-acetyl-beta-D-mannosaminyltransferase
MSSSSPSPASNPPDPPPRRPVLGVVVDALSAGDAAALLVRWGRQRMARVVCLCNVHSVVTAGQDASHAQALAAADLVLPDGAPVAWMLRRQGLPAQRRVPGPDLMTDTLARAAAEAVPVFLYGSRPDTLHRLQQVLRQRWPDLPLAGALSPPFGARTAAEVQADIDTINRSGAGIVWVGLGCPKQESWMADHREQVQAVMVGVGAAFDFLAGTTPRAPRWLQALGLEWLHRVAQEPRRLAGRYLVTNTRFLFDAAAQLLRSRGRR